MSSDMVGTGEGEGMSVRSTYALCAALVTVLLLLPAAASAGSPSHSTSTVDPRVMEEIANKGQTTFWVILRDKADLSPAFGTRDWTARGGFVYEQLTSVASGSQAGLRLMLQDRGAVYQPFWIINAIRVTGGQDILTDIAARPEVAEITADRTFEIPQPLPGKDEPGVETIEWNIDRVNAPQVWSTFGDRGEGIVVASIDTGVLYTHAALVNQYRGNLGGGSFDHNYNWFDPSFVCGSPSLAPCDNNGHGTHTMGTMVGDDGDPGTNQIGVAPHARWITAKGCESSSCSLSALLASGQWMLAPTDLNGNNPRPDLRPNIVSNSWGDGPFDPFYQATVQAWVAAGLFPSFANGNGGSACNTASVPGAYPESYGVGAFDISNNIAFFSSRGPSFFGGIIKPNIAAPGVNVRSSWNDGSYFTISGTSMATPHLSATVALMWSAAPSLIGDIAATRSLLDSTAINTSDLTCGGTPENNNVWGEGRLDAFAAVNASPRGPTGNLTGTVTNANTGVGIGGATVQAVGPMTRTVTTRPDGTYGPLLLSVGHYDVTATAFGYISQTMPADITQDTTTTLNFALTPALAHQVSGHVRDTAANPIAGAHVTILGTPIPPATTDAAGFYNFASVPEGTYDARAESGRCSAPQTRTLMVTGDVTNFDFALAQRSDAFGYFCQIVPVSYVDGDTPLPLMGDDNAISISLPFLFTFYGQTYGSAIVCTNGFLSFTGTSGFCPFSNSAIPSMFQPNAAIYPFWDDLFVLSGDSTMWTKLTGSAPNRQFSIEWRNTAFFGDSLHRVNFEVVLNENGRILTQYRDVGDFGRQQGNSATIGIENEAGTVALQYSFNEAAIAPPSLAVLYRLPPSAFVEGTVTDANDGLALAGATVRALRDDGSVARETTTNAAGFYRMQLRLGTYTVNASKTLYSNGSAHVVLDVEDATVTQNFALRTARAEVSPAAFQFIVPIGQTRTKILTLSNTGTLDMTWEIRETGGGRVATSSTLGLPKNPAYDPNAATTEGLYSVKTPGGWAPSAPGNVIRSWLPTGLSLAWGVGYTGNVWLSDVPTNDRNHEFTVLGVPTGRSWPAPWAGAWPGDMALDTTHNLMCQVNVGGDNGIYCWNINTGAVVDSITGAFPWTTISQRGLAYRPDDDSFYIGGWNQGILYHVKGLSYADKGAVIGQCNPPDGSISGLAWNSAFSIVWEATNSPTDTIYELNPSTCAVLATLPHPNPGFSGAGLEMDEAGNLWMIDQSPNTVYLIESGVPAFQDVPWLSETPTSGTLPFDPAHNVQPIQVTVDATGLTTGVYSATLFVQSNSGRQPSLRVPVTLIVPAYFQGVNAGGGAYTDLGGDPWAADQQYTAGSWGYTNAMSTTARTSRPIAGTDDDPLYQTQRRNPLEYRFDGLPVGFYEVDLRFAEIQPIRPGLRLFDVIIEGTLVLPALDIAGEVGTFTADNHVVFVPVTDGQLNVRFVARGGLPPVINAIQVIHRPDRGAPPIPGMTAAQAAGTSDPTVAQAQGGVSLYGGDYQDPVFVAATVSYAPSNPSTTAKKANADQAPVSTRL